MNSAEWLEMQNPYYHAQNIFDSDVEEIHPPRTPTPHPAQQRKSSGQSRKRCNDDVDKSSSFVRRKLTRKGTHLIKVEVIDLNEQHSSDGDLPSPTLSARHVVLDPGDDIMDMVETLINKISKKISDSYY